MAEYKVATSGYGSVPGYLLVDRATAHLVPLVRPSGQRGFLALCGRVCDNISPKPPEAFTKQCKRCKRESEKNA